MPIVGGDTIDWVESIYGLGAMCLVHPRRVKRNAGAKAGDVVVFGPPIGVGVLSAAPKRDALSREGYADMLVSTKLRNRPGAGLCARTDWGAVPILPGAYQLAAQGVVTGASRRNWGGNWSGSAADVTLAPSVYSTDQAFLTDPQTIGGLLVSYAPEAANEVLSLFAPHGWDRAKVIGEVTAMNVGA